MLKQQILYCAVLYDLWAKLAANNPKYTYNTFNS